MTTIKATFAALVVAVAGAAHADTFVPSPVKPGGGAYQTRGGCTAYNSPAMPKGEKLHGRGALRVLEAIYAHQNLARLKAAGGKCTCSILYPTWDAALAEYNGKFRGRAGSYSREQIREFTTTQNNRVSLELSRTCRAQGIY